MFAALNCTTINEPAPSLKLEEVTTLAAVPAAVEHVPHAGNDVLHSVTLPVLATYTGVILLPTAVSLII